MTVLDELSGFEFEEVMEDVFRNLGYENVRQSDRGADVGRDILMEETVDGIRNAVVVECKHTDSVGRPVVQKLHSAVATYDYDGPKRGVVATTGHFTGPAKEYARNLQANGDPHEIELLDGDDLRTLADEIGLDLYNGRIEILCDETLRPYDPTRGVDAPVEVAFQDIENIHPDSLPGPEHWVVFEPFVRIRADLESVFETGAGLIHSIDQTDELVVQADGDGPRIPRSGIQRLVRTNLDAAVDLDESSFEETFDDLSVERFGQTETEYKEWSVDRLRRKHTTTVQYTGDNNVTYRKECEPNLSDISVQSIRPVYLPRVRSRLELGEYAYPYEYYAAGPSRLALEDGIRRCKQCGETDDSPYTYCENCGSVNCPEHTKTERLVGEPVCTGCAVTETFFYSTKYFYDEANLDQFRGEYESMPIHRKALENKPLVAGTAAAAVLFVLFVLLTVGVV
ncbi:MAG: restriction endonuclease [Halovenus sp.]